MITAKSVHVTSFAKCLFLVGAGHDPIAQYQRPGDHSATFVFSARASKVADTYVDLRRQVLRTPVISPPPTSPRSA